MRRPAVLFAVVMLLASFEVGSSSIRDTQQNYEFVNGNWFDGDSFTKRSFYTVDGCLSSKRPKRVDSKIDLKNRYVIPPFGEAHNHNVDGSNAEIIRKYLEDGIFYVKVPNILPRARASVEPMINKPESIDASFANGGLTASHTANLRLLRKHGVKIAIGSDEYRKTAAPESTYIYGLGVFSNLELLKIWCETTPATIFPKRKIGHLEDGFEASFLVLTGNPLEDFQNTTKIEMRVKQGTIRSLKD